MGIMSPQPLHKLVEISPKFREYIYTMLRKYLTKFGVDVSTTWEKCLQTIRTMSTQSFHKLAKLSPKFGGNIYTMLRKYLQHFRRI